MLACPAATVRMRWNRSTLTNSLPARGGWYRFLNRCNEARGPGAMSTLAVGHGTGHPSSAIPEGCQRLAPRSRTRPGISVVVRSATPEGSQHLRDPSGVESVCAYRRRKRRCTQPAANRWEPSGFAGRHGRVCRGHVFRRLSRPSPRQRGHGTLPLDPSYDLPSAVRHAVRSAQGRATSRSAPYK